jgi:hypothetical protein
MAGETNDTLYSVTLTKISFDEDKERVAGVLGKMAKNLTPDRIVERLDNLPWTLTRKASRQTATRLAQQLEQAGAKVRVEPPLEIEPIAKRAPTAPQEPKPIEPKHAPPAYRPTAPLTDGEIPSIKPLSLAGILDRSFQICKENFWPLFGILAIPFVAIFALFLIIALIAAAAGFAAFGIGGKDASIGAAAIVGVMFGLGALVVIFVLFYLSQGAIVHAVSQVYLGRKIGITASYRFIWERAGKFILTSLQMALIVMAGMMGLFIVGLALFGLFYLITGSGWWSAIFWIPLFLIPTYAIPKLMLFDKVVVIEDLAYMKALQRSWELVSGKGEGSWPRGYWLKLIVLLHVFLFINIAISMIFFIPTYALELMAPKFLLIAVKIFSQIINNIASLIASMFGSVCLVVFYYDIRNRKEGFDLRMAVDGGAARDRFQMRS